MRSNSVAARRLNCCLQHLPLGEWQELPRQNPAAFHVVPAQSASSMLDMYGNEWRCVDGTLAIQIAETRWREQAAPWVAVDAPAGVTMVASDGDGFVWTSDGERLWRMDGRKGAVNTPPEGNRDASPNGQSAAPFEAGFGCWVVFPREKSALPCGTITALTRGEYSGWVKATLDDGSTHELNVAPTAVASTGDGASSGFGEPLVRVAPIKPPTWTSDWKEVARLPGGGNHDVFCAVLDGIVYVAGGLTDWWGFPADVHVFDELWAYDICADSWTVATRLPHPTCYCGLCALGDTIWVVGGADDRAPGHRLNQDGEYERGINKTVGFRPSDGTWREGPQLCPEATAVHPGYGPFAVALGTRIYAITMGHASMWSWCPVEEGGGWREEPPPPKGMAQMSGTCLDGVGYIIGQDGCFAFTPETGEWTELPSFPGGDLTAPHVAAHDGKVWVATDNVSAATAFFSPDTQEWMAGPTAPTPNGWGGAASVGGKLLLVAGAHMDDVHGRVIFDDRCFVLRE